MIEASKASINANSYQLPPTERVEQDCGYPAEFDEYRWINEQFEIVAKSCPSCRIPLCNCNDCTVECERMRSIGEQCSLFPGQQEVYYLVGMCHQCRKLQFLTGDALIRHECLPLKKTTGWRSKFKRG